MLLWMNLSGFVRRSLTSVTRKRIWTAGWRWYKTLPTPDGIPDYRRKQYFASLLGSSKELKRLRYFDELDKIPMQDIKTSIKTLEDLGVQMTDITNNLQVLGLPATQIKQHYACLKELGFVAVDAPEIISYPKIISTSTRCLHRYNVLPRNISPLDSIIQQLDCPSELETQIRAACKNPDDMVIRDMRKAIVKCITCSHFGITDSDYMRTVYKKRQIEKSCVSAVKRVVEICSKEFDLESECIVSNPVILSGHPENILQIKELAESYNLNMKSMIEKCPSILLQEYENIRLICLYLNDYDVPVTNANSYPWTLCSKPNDVSEALATLRAWPEFPVLKLRPHFLHVIKYYKRANLHMDYLRSNGFEKFALEMLISEDESFVTKLQHREKGSNCREIVTYLTNALNASEAEIKTGLAWHPLFRKTSVPNVKSVLAYLTKSGFTPRQIVNGIALVVYPEEEVANMYEMLPSMDFAQPFAEWADSEKLLHLLLYAIEKREGKFLKPVPVPSLAKADDALEVYADH